MTAPRTVRSDAARVADLEAAISTRAVAYAAAPFAAMTVPADLVGPAGLPGAAPVPLTENVAWCGSCGAAPFTSEHRTPGRNGTPCPAPKAVGATLPAALDGPDSLGRSASARRGSGQSATYAVRAAMAGTGAPVLPMVSPAVGPTGKHRTRTTARRADGGAVTVRRLTVQGRFRLAAMERHGARYAFTPGLSDDGPFADRVPSWQPVDMVTVDKRNADGTSRKAVTRRRRSRADILAASPARRQRAASPAAPPAPPRRGSVSPERAAALAARMAAYVNADGSIG